jgi:adenylate cyclase class IV
MNTREEEIKIKLDNPAALKQKIASLGGKKTYESLERDILLRQ